MELPKLFCKRCDYKWIPRITEKPKRCPRCKSYYWDTNRGMEIALDKKAGRTGREWIPKNIKDTGVK